jgi:hypothetical protein
MRRPSSTSPSYAMLLCILTATSIQDSKRRLILGASSDDSVDVEKHRHPNVHSLELEKLLDRGKQVMGMVSIFGCLEITAF